MSARDNLMWMPAWTMREMIIRRELSPVELVRLALDRIDQTDAKLHTFVTVAREAALAQARQAEKAVLQGEPLGALHGIPLSIKDMFWVKGMRTMGGSLVYKDYVPAEDSVHAERVQQTGAIIVGKTNTPEFGLAGRTVSRVAPECLNPWNTECTTGGSSGGAAASVVAGMTSLAIGSDGGGSIRLPAAFCGVFGLHPSNGRVPRHGGLGGTVLFSGVGPLSRTVRDAGLLLQVLAKPDPRDPTCRRDEPPDYLDGLESGIEGISIAWTADYGRIKGSDPEVVKAARRATFRLAEAGAVVQEPGLVLSDVSEAMSVMSASDNYALMGRLLYDDPATRVLLAPYTRERYAAGRAVTGAEYALALRARLKFIQELEQLFDRYDLISSPTVGYVAPRLQELSPTGMPTGLVNFTEMVNFAGFTAASVPCGLVRGLPVGLHLIARPNKEALVLRASRAFEIIQPWASQHPNVG